MVHVLNRMLVNFFFYSYKTLQEKGRKIIFFLTIKRLFSLFMPLSYQQLALVFFLLSYIELQVLVFAFLQGIF